MTKKRELSQWEYSRYPTKFRPEFCDQIIEHMEKGYSINSFAGKIGVRAETVKNWRALYPDFDEAAAIGEAKSHQYWERLLVLMGSGALPKGNIKAIELVMKCRFLWSDKQTIELLGSLETRLRQMSDQELHAELRKLRTVNGDISVNKDEADERERAESDLRRLSAGR